MTRSWSLRQLFPMMWNGAPEQGAVKEKVFATGVIRFGDFTIDIDERIVTLCGEELPLTSEVRRLSSPDRLLHFRNQSPIQSEAGLVPPDHRFRRDDDKGFFPL